MAEMNNRYRSVKVGSRGGTFYLEDTQNGKRTSLRTQDHAEAQRLVHARNEADRLPQFNIRMGMAYMAASDPHVATRTWNDVMADIVQDKTGPRLLRWNTALKDKAFNLLRPQVLITTAPDDFMLALRAGTVSTNVYLRRLQNHAVDMGWLPLPILPKKKLPKIKHKEQRAIEGDEHRSIIARETNPERQHLDIRQTVDQQFKRIHIMLARRWISLNDINAGQFQQTAELDAGKVTVRAAKKAPDSFGLPIAVP